MASRIMADRGYAATSISDLCKEAGLPKSAIYHHFESKAGLLTAVMARGARGFFDGMRASHGRGPDGGTPRERLGWYLQRTGEVFLEHQNFLRLLLILLMSNEASDAPDALRVVTEVRAEGLRYMEHMVESAFAPEGPQIAKAVAKAIATFGISGFDGAFVALQADSGRTMPEEMEILTEAMAALGEARATRLRT